MRVFLDANVLFSAANWGSRVARLVAWLLEGHTAVTSDFAIEEAVRNVRLKRSGWSEALEELVAKVETAPSLLFPLPVELEVKDQPILCAAIRAKCDLLATGDRKHFGHLYNQTVDGVTVVSLLGLAKRIVPDAE
ncbi:hypothetical protein [Botrimarina sp.]|uniref:PIN domain-containing protein n=1 Tax=Botrimarina sp. TaxID=2795802 RepID=UPI0032EE8AFD